ncbi:MAG: permease-like cell division protein FtsX [Putridiphycobacter sp.]|nr:permease-like cell division protein FtsX [Putridiphycobacter sp.]
MAKQVKNTKNGLKTAYASTVVGIVLVLSVLGMSAWLVLGINALKDTKIEELEVDLFFDHQVNELDLKQIEAELGEKPYVKKAFYRSADEAWEITKAFVGDDALEVINNENPLSHSVILNLKNQYVVLDSMRKIEAELLGDYPNQLVEVNYREEAFRDINVGLKKFLFFILFVAILLLLVAIALINNTIRLALYSKRFTIKTMQLVGATPRFIRRPFIWQAIWQGLLSGIIAGAMVFGFLLLIEQFLPQIVYMTDIRLFFIVLGGIILFGVLITVISTSIALRKYLRMKLDSLYG